MNCMAWHRAHMCHLLEKIRVNGSEQKNYFPLIREEAIFDRSKAIYFVFSLASQRAPRYIVSKKEKDKKNVYFVRQSECVR